jgi:chromosome segregation ATPase
MSLTTILLIAAGIVGVVAFLKWAGVWETLKGTAKVKTQSAASAATSGVEKKIMEANQLADLLKQMEGNMLDLDGKYGAAQGQVNKKQTALDAAVANLQNVQGVIADTNNMTADERDTLNKAATGVATAEAELEAAKATVAALAGDATNLHDQFSAAKDQYQAKLAEIPQARVKEIKTVSNTISAEFGKKQDAFKEAAAKGSDADAQIDEALARSEADAKLHGGMTDTEKKAQQAKKDKAAADILAKYGKK